jgi:hypothetical protein
MDTSRTTIKARSGSYNFLDKKYNNFINQSLVNSDEETYERWLTYDTIIKELILMDKINYFEEVKYRLTGGEDPNEVLTDIINKDSETRAYMWPHIRTLKNYHNEDIVNRFC